MPAKYFLNPISPEGADYFPSKEGFISCRQATFSNNHLYADNRFFKCYLIPSKLVASVDVVHSLSTRLSNYTWSLLGRYSIVIGSLRGVTIARFCLATVGTTNTSSDEYTTEARILNYPWVELIGYFLSRICEFSNDKWLMTPKLALNG